MSSTYISTVFIFCVALNSFSAAENNAHEEISRKEFEQMKNGMKMLLEKVQIQETRIMDLEMEIIEKRGRREEQTNCDGESETGGRSEAKK